MSIKAILVRHAESTGNKQKLAKGAMEFPLDAKGKAESKQMATRIARYKPTIVVSSPLSRATHPAKAIAKAAGVKLHIDKDLAPWNFGSMQGKPQKEIEPRLRELAKNHPQAHAGGAQSFNQFLGSNDAAMRRVKVMIANGERPAVVTHSRNLREAKHALLGAKPGDPTKGGPEPSGHMVFTGKKLIVHKPIGETR